MGRCKKQGLPCSGNRHALLCRLTGQGLDDDSADKPPGQKVMPLCRRLDCEGGV